jgi:hypothetical protein
MRADLMGVGLDQPVAAPFKGGAIFCREVGILLVNLWVFQ